MQDGKKGKAQTILYQAFDLIKERTNQEPMEVFEQALKTLCLYSK
ncbi:SSU ribosomal protein S7p [Sporolactobacillus inulinus]|uniref:30S ribosomal protein S7 n=1 Tax=Sporolactobacillus inulinus TaxID=2078 RepID=A0A4Y1ZGZ7_9BACL|nr:SSU ribosomal protein S7p [Sporolactobacillus inulinus]